MQEVDRDQKWSQWKLRVQRASFQFLGDADASENPKEMCWLFSKLLGDCETLEKNEAKKQGSETPRIACGHWSGPSNESTPLWLNTSCDWVPFMVKLLHSETPKCHPGPSLLIWLRILKKRGWVWGGAPRDDWEKHEETHKCRKAMENT